MKLEDVFFKGLLEPPLPTMIWIEMGMNSMDGLDGGYGWEGRCISPKTMH